MPPPNVTMDREATTLASSKQSAPRKPSRRRSSKTYQCSIEGCSKVYSRAEHLSRHQLNHDPKEVFKCPVPNCSRSFVRSDLHSRHEARHMSEYLRKQSENPRAQQHSGSAESSGLMDYALDSILDPSQQVQIQPQFSTFGAQASCQYQQAKHQSASLVPIGEVSTQPPMISNHSSQNVNRSQHEHLSDIGNWGNVVTTPPAMPLYGGDSYSRSLFTIPDDFIKFLFSGNQPNNSTNDDTTSQASFHGYTNTQGQFSDDLNTDIFNESYLPQLPSTLGMTPYETNFSTTALSNEKSQEIYNLIRNRLTGDEHTPELCPLNSLLEGDRSQNYNAMSRHMMQEHINSYWMNFHSQLPILHWPTFSPNETPNLLLISIMVIGAACSVKSDDGEMAKSTFEFSTVLAWYLRWELFRCMHIQMDDLWVFQTLLLLETYEKTYSSRILHERAYIHHATAIMLMRRGNFLVGRSPSDAPEENESGSQRLPRSPQDVWWEQWIRREATRRVAFAAFMIDSTHAAMFGHSMIMVTHEMRLVLPCDDALWSATNVDEVRKVETMLRLNGVKPLPFIEGLQRTLNGQEIHTNAFGRSILLCGLLSVSWHMNQREMQINSLDVRPNGRDRGTKWRGLIIKAFDLWRDSYEHTAQAISNDMPKWTQESDAFLGSRSALYHLAQISVHADILECQVSAGANRVLGRVMRKKEAEHAQWRIRNTWAPTLEARKATFFALRFLCSVFRKPTDGGQSCDRGFIINYATSNTILPMHRWVLYFAALIVWCYSYAVDGPAHVQASIGSTIDENIHDMLSFLELAEKIKSPEDVAFHRLSGCTGMLRVLCFIFRKGTWELLHEGADLLTNCIHLIESGG